MRKIQNTAGITLKSPLRAQGEIDYRIEGRILKTAATGPFSNELIAAIPAAISALITRLAQQGKWGQIVTFQRNALAEPSAIADFAASLKARYQNPETNPVTALVFGPDVVGGQLMAPRFQKCYEDAGVQSRIFEDRAAALFWVASRIQQSSTLIAWNDGYKIGDSAIDEQHQELFLRASDVIAATTREGQTLCTTRLYQFTRTHFSHEETLMRRLGYPDIEEHIKQHNELMSQLGEFSQHLARDTLIKAELEAFISHWFLTHVATADAKLAAFLKS
jgi:hemerythrin-like metal-binding protein